jgi:type II secretory pathway pseudopilin PulG
MILKNTRCLCGKNEPTQSMTMEDVAGKISLIMAKGFSLAEMLVVTAIFFTIFAMILTVLTNSDQTFRLGQDKLTEQQEARKAMDNIARLLRRSNPSWDINGTAYPVTISQGNARLDFYEPVFDASGNITRLKKVTYKLDPLDSTRLLKKEGTADERVIAHNLSYLYFGAGCSGCANFNCLTPANDCPQVNIDVRTMKRNEFELSSRIALRNLNTTLSEGVEVEEPQEGEF